MIRLSDTYIFNFILCLVYLYNFKLELEVYNLFFDLFPGLI